MDYRPDVDGLRAISVIAVIVFHLDSSLLVGGFQGVDVFFVISGYLITKIIRKDLVKNNFSITNFYNRRIKRILPSFYSVILFTSVLAYLFFLPDSTLNFADNILSANFFYSNIFFYFSQNNYFYDSHVYPLLNLWSLSLEEQFYFLYPLLLVSIRNIRIRSLIAFTVVLFLITIFVSELLISKGLSSAAFYLTPIRMSGILAGCLAAFIEELDYNVSDNLHLVFSVFGVILISNGLFLISSSGFPGLNSLYTIIGTFLLMLNRGDNIVKKVLGIKLLTYIGKRSYSLYLFHLPLFTIFAYMDVPYMYYFLAILGIFVCSEMNYRYIESPFRFNEFQFKDSFKKYYLYPSLFIVIVFIIIKITNGLDIRYPNKLKYEFKEFNSTNRVNISVHESYNLEKFLYFDKENQSTFLIYGDSHARHFYFFAVKMAQRFKFNLKALTYGNCPPGLSSKIIYKGHEKKCDLLIELMDKNIDQFRGVILAGAYSSYLELDNYEKELSYFLEKLSKRKKKVIVLGQVPSLQKSLNKLNFSVFKRRFNLEKGEHKDLIYPMNSNKLIENLSLKMGFIYLDFDKYFEKGDQMSPFSDSKELLYKDSTHIYDFSSLSIGERFEFDSFELMDDH